MKHASNDNFFKDFKKFAIDGEIIRRAASVYEMPSVTRKIVQVVADRTVCPVSWINANHTRNGWNAFQSAFLTDLTRI